MDFDQGETIISQLNNLTELVEHLNLAVDSIYTILGFTVVLAAAGFVIYLVLYPIKIFINGGYI